MEESLENLRGYTVVLVVFIELNYARLSAY